MIIPAVFVLCGMIGWACATPTARSMQVHESREAVPHGFVSSGSAPPETLLDLRIALVQSDIPGLHKALYDVSMPDSPLYGKHLTKEEVEKYVIPKQGTVAAVHSWLAGHGIGASNVTPTGDWIGFSVPVEKAAEMFEAEFSVYTHQDSGTTSIRTLSYSIPTELVDHIELVHPTISPPAFHAVKGSEVKREASAGTATAPALNCTVYRSPWRLFSRIISGLSRITTTPPTSLTFVLTRSVLFTTFLVDFRPDLNPNTTFSVIAVDNATNSQNASLASDESNFDIQYTVGLASGVPVDFITVGNSPGITNFHDTAIFLLNQTSISHVVTTSYAGAEKDNSPQLLRNLCNMYAQIGARGTSLLFSSGDGGVGLSNCTTFIPTFPTDCPFVTAVGATTNVGPETAAPFSSGGFSNYFPTPSYQTAAVSGYLSALGNQYAGLFNCSGRGFPDVSAQGIRVEFVKHQANFTFRGTSVASPIFASIVALLNDELIAAGKPPLGFLNPLLYSTAASAFTDVTIGSNPGCGTNGFPAKVGWDPVTGLGTPNFTKLRTAVGL
ncbi:family S53 protease [Trametes meyenii]|nr:family S53 protease [Trametes meyenii]